MVSRLFVIAELTSCLLYRLDRLSAAAASVSKLFYGSRKICACILVPCHACHRASTYAMYLAPLPPLIVICLLRTLSGSLNCVHTLIQVQRDSKSSARLVIFRIASNMEQ